MKTRAMLLAALLALVLASHTASGERLARRPLATEGDAVDNPINLGSLEALVRDGDSTGFADTILGGCNDPENYVDNKGDGGDVFFKWTAPYAGYITVSACSNTFAASLTVLGDGFDAEGTPITNGNLGCGGVFESCSDPNLNDPDSQLILEVTQGQVLIFHVTGTEATDFGAFKLNIDLKPPGASLATATYIDNTAPVAVASTTAGYPLTHVSPCSTVEKDGPDRYFSYAVPVTGVVTVKACGKTSFNPTVTIMAEASVEGGSATPVACGTCSKPAIISAAADQFIYIVVTGSGPATAGAFDLTITTTAPLTVGSALDNPIDLGSPAKLSTARDSSKYIDSLLGGCNDPENYVGNKGDGGDMFFKWTAPYAGYITVSACSNTFAASLTVLGDGFDAEGTPITNGNLGCGGVFESCSDPNLNDPDSQLILEVTQGQVLIFHVTGTDVSDYGAFKLNIDLKPPGASLATATYIGDKASMAVASSTKGYPATHVSPCSTKANDGPDRYHSYAVPSDGVLTVKACGKAGFPATVTILAEAAVEGGSATPVACGTCAKPARITAAAGSFYYIAVTGTKPGEAGDYDLSIGVKAGTTVGSALDNPIDLGSPAKLSTARDSSKFVDRVLGSCNDPENYVGNKGDGGDVFFKWTVPFAGFLTASACSETFAASLTVLGDGIDAEGAPIVNGNLGCGGVFNGCSDPNLNDPDSQLILEVTQGQVLIFHVTGTDMGDYGAFKLNIDLALPGSSLAVATYIGNKARMEVSGTTKGYPQSFASTCNGGKPDGTDMYYSYSPAKNGTLTAKACGTGGFLATVTIMAEAAVEGGKPTALACGTCTKPAVANNVVMGAFYYVVVSGTKSTDAGAFKLTLVNK